MPVILSLDISSSAGWATREMPKDGSPADGVLNYGVVALERRAKTYGEHPWGYYEAAKEMARLLWEIVEKTQPEAVVVEETNGSKNRFSQKFLEYIHAFFLDRFNDERVRATVSWLADLKVVYINTSEWRRVTDCHLTKEDKNRNAKLSRHKRKHRDRGTKLDKKALGIAGKTTIKHVAIRRANELYGLSLRPKDDDVADAILLLHAYINGAKPCMGSEDR